MKLQFKQGQNLIFIDKPTGFQSQLPLEPGVGLAEAFSLALQKKLQLASDIENRATGATALAENSECVAEIQRQLSAGLVQRKFWFVTDRKSTELKYQLTESSKKQSPLPVQLSRIKRSPFFELWEIDTNSPLTVATLRQKIAELGLPILGDTQNGGTASLHLFLHHLEISVPGEATFYSPPPRVFERLGVLRDKVLSDWLMSIDSRQRLFNFLAQREQTLRLSHSEDLKLRWEALGPVLWGAWYREEDPTPLDIERFEFLAHMLGKQYRVRKMLNRGKDPLSRIDWSSPDCPNSWMAKEGELKFHFDANRGLSHGLFLDQRHNRDYVYRNSKNQRVLNLFAYTCGFSLAAAVGGADEVASVDVSREFLDWGKQNFQLNNLDPERYEFFKQDSLLFLKGATKRGRQFDIIICDPPSFARNKDSLFSIEKNLEDLLKLCFDVMSPNGLLIFSCNLEKWSQNELEKRISRMKGLKQIPAPQPVLDYEKPHEVRLLKTVFLKKH